MRSKGRKVFRKNRRKGTDTAVFIKYKADFYNTGKIE